jgi:hypothetical protein
MAKRQPRTVLEVCVASLGVHRGAVAAANVAQWAIATSELGHVPTVAEYVDYWAITDRSGWNHAARVREALGDDWRAVVDALSRHLESHAPGRVMRAPLAPPVTV